MADESTTTSESAPATAAPPAASAVSAGATRAAVALLTGMNLLNYVDRFVLPAVIERVRRDIPMSDTEQGVALTAFIWVYMVTAPVFGRLGDTGSRKRLIALGVGLWSIATALGAFVTGLWGLIAARALVGVGEAAYATISPSLIADYYPPSRRGRLMAMFFVATPVGSALGYVLGGSIARAYSWRAAFLAVGLPGLALALAALAIREPPRGQFDRDAAATPPLRDVWPSLVANRPWLLTTLGWTAYTFAIGGLAQWMPSYLQRVRHMDLGAANNTFGAILVVAGLAGTLAGGGLVERLRGRVRHPDLWVCGVTTAAGVPFVWLAFRLQGGAAVWASIAVAEFFLFFGTGPVNAVLLNALPPAVRTTGFAASILMIHLLGDAVSPALIGFVSDRASLAAAVLLVPFAFALAAAVWLYAQRALPGEI